MTAFARSQIHTKPQMISAEKRREMNIREQQHEIQNKNKKKKISRKENYRRTTHIYIWLPLLHIYRWSHSTGQCTHAQRNLLILTPAMIIDYLFLFLSLVQPSLFFSVVLRQTSKCLIHFCTQRTHTLFREKGIKKWKKKKKQITNNKNAREKKTIWKNYAVGF